MYFNHVHSVLQLLQDRLSLCYPPKYASFKKKYTWGCTYILGYMAFLYSMVNLPEATPLMKIDFLPTAINDQYCLIWGRNFMPTLSLCPLNIQALLCLSFKLMDFKQTYIVYKVRQKVYQNLFTYHSVKPDMYSGIQTPVLEGVVSTLICEAISLAPSHYHLNNLTIKLNYLIAFLL